MEDIANLRCHPVWSTDNSEPFSRILSYCGHTKVGNFDDTLPRQQNIVPLRRKDGRDIRDYQFETERLCENLKRIKISIFFSSSLHKWSLTINREWKVRIFKFPSRNQNRMPMTPSSLWVLKSSLQKIHWAAWNTNTNKEVTMKSTKIFDTLLHL